MSSLILRINSTNAALVGVDARDEVVRILRDAATRVEMGHDCFRLYDINGNQIGTVDADIDEESERNRPCAKK